MNTHALVVVSKGELRTELAWKLPYVTEGKIRAKVKACGLNFADLLMISGKYQDTPPIPFVPGMEICAEVVELGSGVTHLSVSCCLDRRPCSRIKFKFALSVKW